MDKLISGSHFGNNKFIESYGKTYDQYTQNKQTQSLLATVGLAQVPLN